MPALAVADLHWSSSPRDDYRHKFVDELVAIAKDYKASPIMVLGDLTEQKDRHNAELTNHVVDHMRRLAAVAPVVIVRGNHDWLNDPACPFFAFLGHLANVTWVNDPTLASELPIKLLPDAGRVLLLPHTPDYQRDWKPFDLTDYNVIFCHNTFAGSVGDSGHELSGIPTKVFAADSLVISGDVHKPQSVGPVTYVGAPYTVDFGDDYQPRVLLIRDDGLKVTSIACEGPQKRLVDITNLADLKKVKGVYKGDIVKVRLSITRSEHPKWHEMASAVREWGAGKGYNIHMVQPVLTDDNRRVMSRRKSVTRDDEKILREYGRKRGIDEATLKVGRKLMDEA